jgi:hypothetical protein
MSTWREIQKSITTGQVLRGLPNFATYVTRALWEITPSIIIHAIQVGDVALFVSIMVRLDQLDCAMVRAGRTIADRAPLTKAKFAVSGLLGAAGQNLVRLGGEWPLPTV